MAGPDRAVVGWIEMKKADPKVRLDVSGAGLKTGNRVLLAGARAFAFARRGAERLARTATGGRQGHRARVHALGAVLRHRADDGHLFADLQRVTAPAAA